MSTKELLLGRSMNYKIYALSALALFSGNITQSYNLMGIPEYQGLVSDQQNLLVEVKAVCQKFKSTGITVATVNQSNFNSSAPFFLGQPVTTVQVPYPTPTIFQGGTYSSIFPQFASLIGAPNYPQQTSYLSLFATAFDVYKQVVPAPSSSAPFEKNGAPIVLFTALAGAVTSYIQARLASLTLDNYAQIDGATTLKKELTVIDGVMSSALTLLKNKLSSADAALASTYQTIQQQYAQRKAQLLLGWLDPLLTQLCTRYALSLAQSGQIKTDLNVNNVDGYVTLLINSLSAFSATQTTTVLGQYSSPTQAIVAVSAKVAQLYNYQALVYKNALEHNIQVWGQPGVVLSQEALTTMNTHLQKAQSYYNAAATYYGTAQQTTTGQAYAQLSSAIQLGAQNWQNAVTNVKQGYAGQAAQAFQQASTQCKNAGFTALSSYLYQQYQQALFAYDQSIFDTYSTYYQPLVAYYSAQAQKIPATPATQTLDAAHAAFQKLFYPLNEQQANNAPYKGMGWLAQVALPSFKDMLSTLQTLAQQSTATSNVSEQQQYLQQAIALLQKISQGSQYIFYTSPDLFDTSKRSADENSSSYTVSGLVESLEQYNTITTLFSRADTLIAQPNAYAALPFSQLLPQGSIATWKQFIMLHQAYWLLLCAQQARAYVGCAEMSAQSDELISFAVIALLNAQALYKQLGQQLLVTYIKNQLMELVGSVTSPAQYHGKTVQQLLQQKAQKYAALPFTKQVSLLNVQAAVACYQAGGLLGFASLRQHFFAMLDAYNAYVSKNIQDPFLGFTLAALAVQEMYAQDAGWEGSVSYTTHFSDSIARFTLDLTTFASSMASLVAQKSYQQAITKQQLLVTLYDKMQAFEREQEQLAALYGVTTGPYLLVTHQDENKVIAFKASTLKDPLKTFYEPSYALALFSSDYAQALYQQLKTALGKNTFTGSMSQQIAPIESLYNQAAAYYSAAGMQKEVITTENLKSQAIELLYFNMVIPSEAIKTMSLTQLFGATGQQKTITNNQPLYLLRSLTIDLTALAQSFITNTSVAQAAVQSSSLKVVGSSVTTLAPEIETAQQLLTTAKTFVGKTSTSSQDITALLNTVLLPLYRIQLQQEGYNGLLPLDEQVLRYGKQLQTMMTSGMIIFGQVYKTSYTVTTQQQADGTEHIMVQGINVPLDAVPQYPNQTQSALLYYTLCNQFFDTTQATTTIGNTTYMTFSNQQLQQQVAEATQRAYLAGTVQYASQIEQYIATLQATKTIPLSQATLAQKATLNFSDYQTQYANVNNMFMNLLALIEGANQALSTSGSNDSIKAAGFAQFAKVGTYFLMGDPSSSAFQSVLKDIANNYYNAAQVNQRDLSPYIAMAKLYEQVGDYTITLPLSVPQVHGYPSTQPTGNPTTAMLSSGTTSFKKLKNINVSCNALSTTLLYPYTNNLVWKNYQKAVGFYQQAYGMYQQGYALDSTAVLSNADTTRTYGKFFYYDLFSALQVFSLFARNAYQVGSDGYTVSLNQTFQTLVQQGGSDGTQQATQGFDELTQGSAVTVNQYAQQQYNVMRTSLLNALIYLTGLQGALNQLLQNLGINKAYTGQGVSANNPLTAGYGQLLMCGLTAYIPGLEAKISALQNGQSEDSKGPIFDVPVYQLDLQSSFDANNTQRIFNADTFLTVIQYIVENSIGSPVNNFASLGKSANQYVNLLIFNTLVSELWSIMRDAYGQTFLTSLYKAIQGNKNQQNALTAYENSIDNAIQTQEQTLLINPASYIG